MSDETADEILEKARGTRAADWAASNGTAGKPDDASIEWFANELRSVQSDLDAARTELANERAALLAVACVALVVLSVCLVYLKRRRDDAAS